MPRKSSCVSSSVAENSILILTRRAALSFPREGSRLYESGEHSEDEWQAAIGKIDSTMKEFRTLIESADESKFDVHSRFQSI